jgi:MFS family permease
MKQDVAFSSRQVLLPTALGTGLSLIGDTALYAVLPTHALEAGVTVATIGILLSANRFVRLFLNGPLGLLYDRFPRRYLFVASLFIGAVSTAIYALTSGFWPLLLGRLLWGLAWAGIWVGGNTIILDISNVGNRGRWVGIYQTSFFLGASAGAVLGGILTDWLGFHQAMGIGAALTLLGAIIALIFLPETKYLRIRRRPPGQTTSTELIPEGQPHRRAEFASAMALLGVNRLVLAGILLPTFGLYLLQQIGATVEIAGLAVGVATLTGLALGLNALVAMASTPLTGNLSDKTSNRWQVAAAGLIPGITGFALLAFGSSLTLMLGIPLTAVSGGSNQGLSTALVGDMSPEHQRGRRLGGLFTVGDFASAIGPPLAYSVLIPTLGLSLVYLLCGGLFAAICLVALIWAVRLKAAVGAGGTAQGIDQ